MQSQEEWTKRFMDIEDDRLFTYCVIRAPYFIRNFPDKSAWDDVVTSLARGKIDSNQETSDGENKKRFHCYTGECVKCCKEGSAVTMTILDLYRIWSLLKQQGHEKNFIMHYKFFLFAMMVPVLK